MNKPSIYRITAYMIPIICCCIALGVIIYEAHRLGQFRRELTDTDTQIGQIQNLIKVIESQPPISVVPVVEQTSGEQPDFLKLLRSYAGVSHVQVVNWANSGGASANASGDAAKKLPPGVSSVASTIEVSGKYNDIRIFLYRLILGARLLNISDMTWNRTGDKWPITHLKFNLTRYVATPGNPAITQMKAVMDPVQPFDKAFPSLIIRGAPAVKPVGAPKQTAMEPGAHTDSPKEVSR